jgi:Family of unknown function (DUF5946)
VTEVSACPGCGAVLADDDWPLRRKLKASPACWHVYTTVVGHESEHLVELGGLHQLTVDAYGAQHAGEGSPAIGLPFSLIGLHLALDEEWTGLQVRAAHQAIAQRRPAWPSFARPDHPEWLVIADVATATNPEDHARLVKNWAASVWQAWSPEHARVREWANLVLPPSVRGQLVG